MKSETISTQDAERIAKAVADEQGRRQRKANTFNPHKVKLEAQMDDRKIPLCRRVRMLHSYYQFYG